MTTHVEKGETTITDHTCVLPTDTRRRTEIRARYIITPLTFWFQFFWQKGSHKTHTHQIEFLIQRGHFVSCFFFPSFVDTFSLNVMCDDIDIPTLEYSQIRFSDTTLHGRDTELQRLHCLYENLTKCNATISHSTKKNMVARDGHDETTRY